MNFYTKLSGCRKVNLYKFLLVMRFTLILIFAGMLQVSAKSYGQQFTLNQKNVSIKQIFKEIKLQTGYDILWQPDKLDGSQKIDAHFKSAPLSQVINECIAGHNLVFEIQDQSIVLKSAPVKMGFSLPQDSVIFKGKVTDENGTAMGGVTVKVMGSRRTTFTTSQGNFSIYAPSKGGTLEITYVGYQGKQITLTGLDPSRSIVVKLVPGNNNLGEVNIVSTGYQDLAKERATGSFEVVTKEQLQHSSDPDLIKRLEGITTSMNFNNNLIPINSAQSGKTTIPGQQLNSSLNNLTIRGRNTLQPTTDANNVTGQVLVVIDGIASPYSIDKVNPNDVESITVLKDAAAASIWGSQAANGVIVVKTKRGSYEKPLSISFNTNFNVTDKLDLFYKKKMSTSDYIDAQISAYKLSGTTIGAPSVTQNQMFYSPVAEILEQQRVGQLTQSQATAQLDALRGNDVRQDYDKYLLRDAFTQSYSLGIDGGAKKIAYRVSAAYDNTLNNTISSGADRLSLGYNTSIKPLKNLEINANINYTQNTTHDQMPDNPVSVAIDGVYFFPYTKLVDNQGNPINIPYKYRPAFVNLLSSTYGNKIQDLHYNPLENINEGYSNTKSKSLNFNLGTNYKISPVVSLNIIYNYNRGNSEQEYLDGKNSFYMRDLVTFYTTPPNYINPFTGQANPLAKQIPLGGLYRPTTFDSNNQILRGQLNLNKEWNKNSINAIAGMDAAQIYTISKAYRYYGYDENTLKSNNTLDYIDQLTTLYADAFGGSKYSIPSTPSQFLDNKVRTYSMYANAAYTYNRRYTLSASIRKDASSAFGVGTNKTGTPFYSLGTSWNIANEDFYSFSWLPKLQLRSTFGYNGNVNPYVYPFPLLNPNPQIAVTGLPFNSTTVGTATNNDLRPEKTGVINLGIDFGFKNNRLSGSLEYYDKRTKDAISTNSLDPTTGFNTLPYNSANLNGQGVDVTINSQNLQYNLFSWTSNFLFSYNRVKVTHLYTVGAVTAGQVINAIPNYNEGYDLSRLFAFRWAGLDPLTGNPRGYLNGQPVSAADSYSQIVNQPSSTTRYFGSAVPVYYGSFRNTFRYGAFSISANILYKLGYYFRRPLSDVVQYANLFGYNANTPQGAEFNQRWQRPGDETKTNVPSMIYPGNALGDLFYQYAEINVQKADHIRLQEINLSYSLSKKNWFIKNPRIYANISNLGIIWRANKLGLDPDIYDYPNPRTYAFGFSANF